MLAVYAVLFYFSVEVFEFGEFRGIGFIGGMDVSLEEILVPVRNGLLEKLVKWVSAPQQAGHAVEFKTEVLDGIEELGVPNDLLISYKV